MNQPFKSETWSILLQGTGRTARHRPYRAVNTCLLG